MVQTTDFWTVGPSVLPTGYVWDPLYCGHAPSRVHPEHPDRARALDPSHILPRVPGVLAIRADPHLGGPWLTRVHRAEYVDEVRWARGRGRIALDASWETRIAPDTFDVAVRAVGGALSLTAAVIERRVRNGFAATRPPGHHAQAGAGRGFCVFNNVAICARFAQQHFGMQRILIVDWDVHPADGTSGIFWEDPDVYVLSVHQEGIFADSVGRADQCGAGPGEGTIRNVPLPPRTTATRHVRSFATALEEAALRFRPELVLVSCGFDAHLADPLGQMCLREEDFAEMTAMVVQTAEQYAGDRLVSVLEGGYSPPVLQRCVLAHLRALTG